MASVHNVHNVRRDVPLPDDRSDLPPEADHPLVDLPDEELRVHTAETLERARDRSTTLTEAVDDDDLVKQHSKLMSPLVWDLAHIGHYEELWLLRTIAGATATDPRFDDLYGGETYDASYELPGFDTPGYDDADWAPAAEVAGPKGELVNMRQQPIRVTESLPAVGITEPQDGTYVVKFPRVLAGNVQITAEGPAGTTIRYQYGEKLRASGLVNFDNNGGFASGFQTDRFVLADWLASASVARQSWIGSASTASSEARARLVATSRADGSASNSLAGVCSPKYVSVCADPARSPRIEGSVRLWQ